MLKTDDKMLDFRRSLELIGHFRAHLQLLGDENMLALLRSLDSEVFGNSDVRSILRITRKAAWLRLAKLGELGFVEKRGYSYRIAPSGHSLVKLLALALKSAVTGATPSPDPSLIEAVVKLGSDAVEWAYAKGRIDRSEYLRYKKGLVELEEGTARNVAQH